MARRGFIESMIRDMARANRTSRAQKTSFQREAARADRERQRADRERARMSAQNEREARRQYLDDRAEEVNIQNNDLKETIKGIQQILEQGLNRDPRISFPTLKQEENYEEFSLPSHLLDPPTPPDEGFYRIAPPKGIAKLLPGTKAKHESAVSEAQLRMKADLAVHAEKLKRYEEEVQIHRNEYKKKKDAHIEMIKSKNAQIDEFESKYRGGDPEAIVEYNTMVLEGSEYPEGFPQEFRLAYVPESKQLVCEYELPTAEIVPHIGEYRYIKSKDEIEEKPRKATEIKDIYQNIVSSIALRTLNEIIRADQYGHIEVVVFNGFIDTIDAATGKDIRPCLISIRVTKSQFVQLDLSRVDKAVCLRNLGAQVSPRPSEAQPVKPIIEFDMVDKRFIEESNVLSDLESRPNLMDLNPYEFENLVANLFGKMGLETKLTRASRDGGVDAVAFDPRPVLGGKVVIQAKRYKNTVGVSAVRDLYGTMLNEGASKGILVATSGYGPDAFEFAKDKPIELIDGGGLLYLLQQIGVKARIIFPDDSKT